MYSHESCDGLIGVLNDKFLNQIRSNGPDFFNQWRANLDNNKLKNKLINLLYTAFRVNSIPVMKLTGHFTHYLETQLAYIIFESLLIDPLDSSNNDINKIPLLDIPIGDIFYDLPKKDNDILNKFINRFSRLKEKQINFSENIKGVDKILLNMKLEIELENVISTIDFNYLIQRIYNDFNYKNNLDKQKLQEEISLNI
tara:strand:- start:629 stop:1222 length:594 start_codon:yes stop_codon:yes gene_type:complete